MRGVVAGCALASALLLASTLAPCGCSSADERLAQQLGRAEALLAEGRDREALREFRGALRVDPRSARTNYEIARISERLKAGDDALFFYREAYRLDPGLEEAGLATARLLAQDDPDQAEEILRALLERHPENAAARLERSRILRLRGDLEAAEAAVEEALSLAPESGEALLQRAHIQRERLTQAGDPADPAAFEAVAAAFAQAAQQLPEAPAVRALLERAALLASAPSRVGDARAAFAEALQRARGGGLADLEREALDAAEVAARAAADPVFLRWVLGERVERGGAGLGVWSELARLAELADGSGRAVYARLLAQRPEDAEARVRFAEFLLERAHAEEAEALLEQALADGVERPVVLSGLTDLYYATGRPDAAARLVERLEGEYPGHRCSVLASARRAIEEGRAAAVAPGLRELTSSADDADVEFLLALAELRRGDQLAARGAIGRGLDLAPDFRPRRWRLLAEIQHAAGDWVGTVQTHQRLQEAGIPATRDERLRHAEALYALGRQEAAHAVLADLLAGPDPDAVALVARHEARSGPDRVRALLERTLAGFPEHAALRLELARLEFAAGRPERAVEHLDVAIATGASDPALRLERGRARVHTGDLEGAERDILESFRADPGLPDAVELLASLHQQLGTLPAAIPPLEEVDARGKLPPAGIEILARLHLEAGNEERAIAGFERALAADPDLFGAKNDLAYLLAKRGESLDRALLLAREAHQVSGGSLPEVADTLGFVYLKKELYASAIAHLEEAIRLAGRRGKVFPALHYHLGLALRGAGREADAARALRAALDAGEFDEREDARVQLERAEKSAAASSDS